MKLSQDLDIVQGPVALHLDYFYNTLFLGNNHDDRGDEDELVCGGLKVVLKGGSVGGGFIFSGLFYFMALCLKELIFMKVLWFA